MFPASHISNLVIHIQSVSQTFGLSNRHLIQHQWSCSDSRIGVRRARSVNVDRPRGNLCRLVQCSLSVSSFDRSKVMRALVFVQYFSSIYQATSWKSVILLPFSPKPLIRVLQNVKSRKNAIRWSFSGTLPIREPLEWTNSISSLQPRFEEISKNRRTLMTSFRSPPSEN